MRRRSDRLEESLTQEQPDFLTTILAMSLN
jgi:hypothetical protein